MRSASSASTISTNLSLSRSPESSREPDKQKFRSMSISESPYQRPKTLSPSPPPRKKLPDSEKKRRRESYSSKESYSSTEMRASRAERGSSRSTRRRYQQASPPIRGRRPAERRSPLRERRRLSNDRQRDRASFGTSTNSRGPPKERSLSPFSKRFVLTQAMNMGR